MASDFNARQIIRELMREARDLMYHGCFEEAISRLNRSLPLEDEPGERAGIFFYLGYCFLRMGWYENAVKSLSQHLQVYPYNNDARFYLASAYGSLRWLDEAVSECKKILASDPTDALALHELALCYRDRGWLQESLQIMRVAKKQATVNANEEERRIIDQSLANMEKEIEEGGEDKLREKFLVTIISAILKEKNKIRNCRKKK